MGLHSIWFLCLVLSLNINVQRFHHDVAYISTPLWSLNTISVYRNSVYYFSFHRLMDIWVVSHFWLSRIMLPWTFMFNFSCEHVFSFLVDTLRRGIVGSYANFMFNTNEELQTVFQSKYLLHAHMCMRPSIATLPHQDLLLYISITAIRVAVNFILLFWFALHRWLKLLKTFPCAYLPFVYLVLKLAFQC